MRGKIFISYRRGDDPGYTHALFQLLRSEFGREQLFMDVEGYIKAGDPFVAILDEHVRNCDVLLAIIGPRWIDARNDKGERRLNDPNDFVRIEIDSALKQGKRVIPVLVNNAAIPQAHDLPEPLRPLAERNAVRLTHERFSADCQGLIEDIRAALAAAATKTPKNLPIALVGGTCLILAAAFAWMTFALRADPTTSRVLVFVFAVIATCFLVVSVLALLRFSKPESPESEVRQEQQ
jgi:TIR domain